VQLSWACTSTFDQKTKCNSIRWVSRLPLWNVPSNFWYRSWVIVLPNVESPIPLVGIVPPIFECLTKLLLFPMQILDAYIW